MKVAGNTFLVTGRSGVSLGWKNASLLKKSRFYLDSATLFRKRLFLKVWSPASSSGRNRRLNG